MSLVILIQKEGIAILSRGGVMCSSIAQWVFNNAPYGTKIVEYKEICEQEFVFLPNYTDGGLF